MVSPALRYWCDLYRRHKHEAVAVDIETEIYDGKIAVVSLGKLHANGMKETVLLTQGPALTPQALFNEIRGCGLIVTFNGRDFDLPRIKAEYPSAMPDNIPVLDLWLLAQAIGLRGGLKLLEKVFNINRAIPAESGEGHTHRLWRKFREDNDRDALEILLAYAKEDSSNLFALADKLVKWAEAKLLAEEKETHPTLSQRNCAIEFVLP